jgi:uncharacterized protein involved in cysteine biosynthesis
MIRDLLDAQTRAFAQLFEPSLRGPLLATLGWTALVVALVWWGAIHELRTLVDRLGGYGPVAALAGLAALVLFTWIGFVALENAILWLQADRIVDAVTARHYPERPRDPAARWHDLAVSGLRLALLALVGNLVALPVYVFAPGMNLVLFLALNGYVLGRGYFDAVALRRMDDRAARLVWGPQRGTFILNGAIVTFLLTIPVLNLVAPVVGLAATVHLLERRCGVFVNSGTDRSRIRIS